MPIIDELVAKLKTAQRAATKAERVWHESALTTAQHSKAFDQAKARVQELESAISVLRNNLKPQPASAGNVTPLRSR